ncbi:unnamed protein product [Somion occarium]|uniref:Restriction endonuclease type IV Mrr domain-containing protein n=1 Tax=Somion occarium TaxID=3059160 RepID=A0ABP1DPT0_9APHY
MMMTLALPSRFGFHGVACTSRCAVCTRSRGLGPGAASLLVQLCSSNLNGRGRRSSAGVRFGRRCFSVESGPLRSSSTSSIPSTPSTLTSTPTPTPTPTPTFTASIPSTPSTPSTHYTSTPTAPSIHSTLSTLSAVHRGVEFEKRSLKILQENLSMSLRRVGGREDGGVDLQGWWWVPASGNGTRRGESGLGGKTSEDESGTSGREGGSESHDMLNERTRIRVIAQCKMEKKKIGPKYIREMEGVLHRHLLLSPSPSQSHHDIPPMPTNHEREREREREPIVGLFISSSPFTKSALLRVHSSPIPFMLLHLPPFSLPSQPSQPSQSLSETPPPETCLHDSDSRLSSVPGDSEIDPLLLPNPTQPGSLGSLICNPALLGQNGPLKGELEPRWEWAPTGVGDGRPGLWWRGRRVRSWTPDAEEHT